MVKTVLNETSYIGAGCRKELAGELKKRGFKEAFVVSGPNLLKSGVTKMVTDILDAESVKYTIFSQIKPNPTIKNVQDGVEAFKKTKAQVIIAIGGGSPMDAAKGMGIIITNPEFSDVKSLAGLSPTKNKSFPLIAFATTAGTAAEVTVNYVITDEAAKVKFPCVDPNDIPLVAFNDTEMMTSMPPALTAAVGMDALTHAIEGYTTLGANRLTDALCWNSIKWTAQSLEKAVKNGKDLDAREGMAYASYVAGMGFSNCGLGIVHSMAHPLGAHFDTPHGVANALLLPYVMEYNKDAAVKKYADIARAFGIDTSAMGDDDAAQAAIDAVKKLSKAINIPQKLSEIGIKESDLAVLAKDAFNDPCAPGNPKKASVEDILQIYKKAL
jgi:lactaldehyde reductase